MGLLEDSVLILNKRFFPLRVDTVEAALYLLFKGRAVVMDDAWTSFSLDEYSAAFSHKTDRAIRTVSRVYIAPEVIRLKERDLVLNRKINLTRQNLVLRDGGCAYCGTREGDLTIDHVIPRSRYLEFGLKAHTTWENTVACCYTCNAKKANRTPEEAEMKLLVKPHRPNSTLKFRFGRKWKPSWDAYLGAKDTLP